MGDFSNEIYIVGASKSGHPLALNNKYLFLPMVIDRESGEILDADMNAVCDTTRRFVQRLLVGQNIYENYEGIILDINDRYHGHSRKSIAFCIRNAVAELRSRGFMPYDPARPGPPVSEVESAGHD